MRDEEIGVASTKAFTCQVAEELMKNFIISANEDGYYRIVNLLIGKKKMRTFQR